MTLNRDDFPEMTDEQWAAISAEGDRRASAASETARKNAEKAAAEARSAAIAEAVEAERARLEMGEQEKLEADRQALAQMQAEIARERRSLAATKKLAAAGLPDDKVEAMLAIFVGVDDQLLDPTLDAFITTYQDTVKSAVDAEKQALLGNATPPAGPTSGHVDVQTQVMELTKSGDTVAALDLLLTQSGAAPKE